MTVEPTPEPYTGPESLEPLEPLEPSDTPVIEPEQALTPVPQNPQPEGNADVTRAGMVWVAVSAGLVVLILLITFILQNQDGVTVKYFGAVGDLSLGMALFIAAVGGGVLVAVAGAVRILQLRRQRRRQRAAQ